MVKVSVIVPVYNVEAYLRKCLDSLVEQTLKEIEIIVVNDGTKDNSLFIMEEYAEKYSNVRIYSKENGGLSDARNFGLQYVTGEYIGFVDSDDYVEKNMYELLYKKAKEENSDIVECNLFHDYPNSQDVEIGVKYQRVEDMIMLGRSVVWNKIYRTSWLFQTGVRFTVGASNEDVEFYGKLMIHVGKVSYIDEALVHYVQREASLIHEASLKILRVLDVLQRLIDYYKEMGVYEKYYSELEFFCARIVLCSSFLRLTRIEDRRDRKYGLDENWKTLEKMFPRWKNNKYFREKKGAKILYMRLMNRPLYDFMGVVLHTLKR